MSREPPIDRARLIETIRDVYELSVKSAALIIDDDRGVVQRCR